MRILHVIPYFYPAWTYGGPVRVAYGVTKKLIGKGHDVSVYTCNMNNGHSLKETQVKEVGGINVYYFGNASRTVTRKTNLFITPEMISVVKNRIQDFDVVHLHEYRTFQNSIIHHYARKYNVPYVLQPHGSLPRIIEKQSLKLFFDTFFGYRLLRDASKVIALNQTETKRCRTAGLPEEKIAVVPNGIDLNEYDDLPPKGLFREIFNISKDKKIILYLGRIHRAKRIDLLVKAYAYLTKTMNYKDTVLVIAGSDDGYLAELESITSSLDVLDTTLFTGFLSNQDKLKALVDGDIFVIPSFYGFPMTILEACAAQTPIVTTTLGDDLEWIDGTVGYVTLPKIRNLTEAIHKVVSSDAIHEKFSKNCRETVKSKFSLDNVVNRLEQVYREVAKDETL